MSWLTGLFGFGKKQQAPNIKGPEGKDPVGISPIGKGPVRNSPARKGPVGNGQTLPAPGQVATPQASSLDDAFNQPLVDPHLQSVTDNPFQVVTSVTDKPWCAVCYLECTFGTKKYIGTGWLIDPTTIITAAHNLWNPPFDPLEPKRAVGPVTRIVVAPAPSDSNTFPFHASNAKRWVYDQRWRTLPAHDRERRCYDYGAIFVDSPGFDTVPAFFTPWPMDLADWPPKVLNCAGFPLTENAKFMTSVGKACVPPGGNSMFIGTHQQMVAHNMSTEGGESGGPIFMVDDNNDPYALAVHTQGFGLVSGANAGVRITQDMIDAFNIWRHDETLKGPQPVGPQLVA